MQPVTPESILLNWLVYEPKDVEVKAGNERVVKEVQFLKQFLRALAPVILLKELKFTDDKFVQLGKAIYNPELVIVVRLLKSIDVKLVHLKKAEEKQLFPLILVKELKFTDDKFVQL